MKKIIACFAYVLALCFSSVSQAAVVTFNSPGLVDINNETNIATYTEAGLIFSGEAASFLPLDDIGTGGTGGLFVLADSTLRLTAAGGLFALSSADLGLFDTFSTGTLRVMGLRGDNSQIDMDILLSELRTVQFQGWSSLQEVRFTADADFILDNVNATAGGTRVPEPGIWLLLGLGVVALTAARRRSASIA